MSGDNSCEEEQPAGERASEPSEHVRSDSEPKRALYVVLFGLCREQTYLRQALDNSWPRVSRASGNWSMRPSIMPRNKRMIPWQTRPPSILSPVGIIFVPSEDPSLRKRFSGLSAADRHTSHSDHQHGGCRRPARKLCSELRVWVSWPDSMVDLDTSFLMIDSSDQIGTRTADNGTSRLSRTLGARSSTVGTFSHRLMSLKLPFRGDHPRNGSLGMRPERAARGILEGTASRIPAAVRERRLTFPLKRRSPQECRRSPHSQPQIGIAGCGTS